MPTVVRSSGTCIPLDASQWPEGTREILGRLTEAPQRCFWIVGSEPRRQALLREWSERTALIPRIHLFDGLVRLLSAFEPAPRPVIRPAERLVRLAQAWHALTGESAGPGLVAALDRFVGDWQASGLAPLERPRDRFDELVQRYLADLDRAGLTDEAGRLDALVKGVAKEDSPLGRFLTPKDLIAFEGHARFDVVPLRLIAELSRRCKVVLWQTAVPGSTTARLIEENLSLLKRRRVPLRLVEDVAAPRTPLAAVSRRLFPEQPSVAQPLGAVPGLFRLDADAPRPQVEQVAQRIKAAVREAEQSGQPLGLRDVAVVVSESSDYALVEEIFRRHGLPIDLSCQERCVGRSRPAQVLTAAWQVILSQWRYEAVRDFLTQAPVRRTLQDASLLEVFFEQRPRARQQRTPQTWHDAWERLVARSEARATALESGAQELPPHQADNRDGYLADQRERCQSLRRLWTSIQVVLQPVIAMDAVIAERARMTALKELAEACLRLLDAAQVARWVAGGNDQPAYLRLVEALHFLTAPPERRTSSQLWQPDALDVLRAVLDNTSYRTPTEAEAVQVLDLEQVGGLHFRHVFVLGMHEGGGTSDRAEAESLLAPRSRNAVLRAQLEQRERERSGRFAQLFEATSERLVLCRADGAAENGRPGRFLQAVEVCAELAALAPLARVSDEREAARRLGKAAAGGGAERGLAQLWPSLDRHPYPTLETARQRLAVWQQRDGWPRRNRLHAPALLRILFPDQQPFSASDLETYAACPLRYFGLRVLKLEERDQDQARIHYGSLIHKVLQTFYDDLRGTRTGAANEPLPPVNGNDRALLLELFEQEWRRLGEGAVPPDLKTLFATEQGVLQLFLDAIARVEDQHGNLHNEYDVVDVALGEDDQGRPVHLSGRIDRIDLNRETAQAIIVDYKTGRATSVRERRTKIDDGRLLQLPLYASALGRKRADLEVVGGVYVHLSENEARPDRALEIVGDVPWKDGKPSEVPLDVDAARQMAITLAGRIRSGDFSLTDHLLGSQYSECTHFCALRHACRSPAGYKDFRV